MPWNKTDPGGEVASSVKGVTLADGRNHRCRDQRANARDRHSIGTVLFRATDVFDLPGNGLYPLIQPQPVAVEPGQNGAHSRRYLVLTFIEDRQERALQSSQPFAHGDALFNQKGPDLVDRRRPAGHQSRPHPMQRLQVQLILALLRHRLQVRSERSLFRPLMNGLT